MRFTYRFTDAGHHKVTINNLPHKEIEVGIKPPSSFLDLSGHGNDGVVVGNPIWVDGRFGKALSFTGEDAVRVEHDKSLEVDDGLTVAAWFKPNSFDTYGYAVDRWSAYLLRVCDQKERSDHPFEFFIWGPGWEPRVGSKTIPEAGRWYHVVGTFDGSGLKIYVNGKLEGTQERELCPSVSGEPLLVGQTFDGTIDDVRAYNRALNQEEIRIIYRENAPVKEGLVLWLGFDE